MRRLILPALIALSIASLGASLAVLSSDPALAQQAGRARQLKQIALTEQQIQGVVAALKEMNPITDKLPENAAPDQKVLAQLERIAKKNGFASNDEYNNVLDNISLILSGIDPDTKKYVGSEAVLKSQIAQVEADKKMSANDKKEALSALKMAQSAGPVPQLENKGNIDLVLKHYDKLNEVLGMSDN